MTVSDKTGLYIHTKLSFAPNFFGLPNMDGLEGFGMDKKYYAHSLEGKPPSEWQPLEEHLKSVAEITTGF